MVIVQPFMFNCQMLAQIHVFLFFANVQWFFMIFLPNIPNSKSIRFPTFAQKNLNL